MKSIATSTSFLLLSLICPSTWAQSIESSVVSDGVDERCPKGWRKQRDVFEDALSNWESYEDGCYKMTLQKNCNCQYSSDSGPFYMKIEDQEVTEQTFLDDSGTVVASKTEVPTMEDLFAKIEILCFTNCDGRGATMAVHECRMTYNDTTGAIEKLYIDWDMRIVDEEEFYVVNEVSLLC
eukprot:CAMPEP_0194045782 /NCGR_PEP_ID=MMETSP0009_2-20130614/18010_1 /TAXON_ID=210454 /ORGANISM="Grammatophora oceanica, Strain CCMP 410" /LENGTH=179 /DNA_ID=CAMNT_0038690759 /DNA_START=42 /DNA_END=581 /DNA_ORIENTATION=+